MKLIGNAFASEPSDHLHHFMDQYLKTSNVPICTAFLEYLDRFTFCWLYGIWFSGLPCRKWYCKSKETVVAQCSEIPPLK